PKTPHLAYGASLDVTLVGGATTGLWLDVTPGDTFTVNVQSNGRSSTQLNVSPSTEVLPFNWKQNDTTTLYVFTADLPGPYLLTVMGDGAATVSLMQGDTLSADRGPIAFGDTVTGTASEMGVDAYSIDLPADTEFTVRLQSEGRASLPILLLPGLRDALQVDRYGDGTYAQYYIIPAALAGPHQILVRMNEGEYTLTIIEGNDLSVDKGTLAPDTPTAGTGTVGKSDRYSFEATPGDVLTFVVDSTAGWDAYFETRAAKGAILEWAGDGSTPNGVYRTFYVDEAGPYDLYVQTDTDYTLTMVQGPYLEGIPSIRAGDSLEVANIGETRYVLDAAEGDWVTIQTTANDNLSINRVYLNDAADSMVFPIAESRDEAQGRYQALFYLPKPAPYFMEIEATSAYTLSVTEGDTLRTDAGEIAVGQSVEGTAQDGQTLVYTLPSVEAGQTIAVLLNDIRSFRLSDDTGQWIDYVYFGFEGPYTSYAAYQLDGLCPCHLQITPNQPTYRLEIRPVAPEVFPAAQPLNLGEVVSGDTGDARLLSYTFRADTDGDLAIRVEFDPTQTAGNRIYMEVQVPGEGDPRYLILDHSQTETGDTSIVQHYPLYFPGEYTLRITNLVGPYTLTVTLE
ncbi:MAG: hypothetical protein K8L91_19110, partial [Anaerolineae bacterium]|nr:hypothetical protein [Anaerolineae bacterium]